MRFDMSTQIAFLELFVLSLRQGIVNFQPDAQVLNRIEHLVRFYSLLDQLQNDIGGPLKLADCSGRLPWPSRGIYFFMEAGENRSDTGKGPRVVRVGTHALRAGSGTKLWTRLSQHRGQTSTGGGNHRGSIFRLITGTALIKRHGYDVPTWGMGNTAKGEVRANEQALEREVSLVIGAMPFLWLSIDDDAGPHSDRGYIERNSIALLSNLNKTEIDPPSKGWLGHDCDRMRVRNSGLWNQNHVDENYDPAFLDRLEQIVTAAKSPT